MRDALPDLVPIVIIVKNILKTEPVTLLNVAPLHNCFSRLLNCTNVTKSCKALGMHSGRKENQRGRVLLSLRKKRNKIVLRAPRVST